MPSKKARILIILSGGLFLLLDQLFKWLAVSRWTINAVVYNLFGWHPFINKGIAFGLPLANQTTVFITTIIFVVIIYFIFRKWKTVNTYYFIGLILLAFGALSNLIDRLFRNMVVDYFFILTGYINLADVLIVGGLLLLIFSAQEKNYVS